jgi:hypothetical protein
MSQPEFTEEEMRALEAEMERITVDDVLIQTTVTLLNLAARKAGVATPPGDPNRPEPDWEQVRQAVEGARALMPLLEERHAEQLGPVRDTLAQLQMIYARDARSEVSGAGPGEPGGEQPQRGAAQPPDPAQPGGEQPSQPGEAGPAQRSGRLWVPGQ